MVARVRLRSNQPGNPYCAMGSSNRRGCFQPLFRLDQYRRQSCADEHARPPSSELFQAGDHRSAHEEQIIGESIAETRLQTEFERQRLEEIQRCVNALIALEKQLAIDLPATAQDLMACCAMAPEDVDHPAKNMTFAEAFTAGKPNGAGDSQSVPV